MRTHVKTSIAVLLAALLVGACGRGPSGGAVATVDGEPIASDLFERLVTAQVNNPSSPIANAAPADRSAQIASLQRQVLTQLIRTAILERGAADFGVEVTEEEIDERFAQEEAFSGDPDAFARRIAELGYTQPDARGVLRSVLAQEKFEAAFTGDIEITDADLRAYYEERKPFEYELADARHILVETQAEADEILALLAGGADFAQLAQERSTDTVSAVQGGSLGRAPRGSYVTEFDEAVWSADLGAVVGPVQTQFGFHIIRVDEFVNRSFEEVREEIETVLRGRAGQDQLNAYVQALFAEADVEVESRFGRWDPTTGQVVDSDPLG